jgi:hypothetical protein
VRGSRPRASRYFPVEFVGREPCAPDIFFPCARRTSPCAASFPRRGASWAADVLFPVAAGLSGGGRVIWERDLPPPVRPEPAARPAFDGVEG